MTKYQKKGTDCYPLIHKPVLNLPKLQLSTLHILKDNSVNILSNGSWDIPVETNKLNNYLNKSHILTAYIGWNENDR